MQLIDDLLFYKKRVLNDSCENLYVVTGIDKSRLNELIACEEKMTEDEKYLIERLIY